MEQAREIKNFVRSTGVMCWFDKDSFIAGEVWDRSRQLALRKAEVVIVVCSAATTERNGIYQRELNEALQLSSDRRLGTVHIIPLRMEDCSLPPELSRLQYVDYFEPTWRRKVAGGLAKACGEAGEEVPLPLAVAAAEPDESNVLLRSISEECCGGTLEVDWFTYAIDGDYWDLVNGVIRARALGGLFEARRQLSEWWKPADSCWELHLTEFHRKGQLVSLMVASWSYFTGAAHPSHGVQSINILGEGAGIVPVADLFEGSNDGLKFITDFVNLDLRRQYLDAEDKPNMSQYAEENGWILFEHYNFNESGMQINLSSASCLLHVLGEHQVYAPWQIAGQFLAPTAKRILLGE